jgi:hypothetical protein
MFILGPTGTGKSTFVLHLITQLLNDRVPCWLFDFKRNYRCLLSATVGRNVTVFTVGRNVGPLRVNALRAPPGVLIAEWIEALADVMSSAYLLMQGARNVLKDVLGRVSEVHGVQATFAHAYRLLREDLRQTRVGGRRFGWIESAARTLEELSSGSFGLALNATGAMPLAALLDRSAVFEAQSLGDDQKRFFCLYALQYVLLLRKHGDERRETLQHVLVFDESHHVFPKDPPGMIGVPSRLAREIREYGESIIAASQQSDVSESLIANAGFKVVLRCDFPRDVDFASRLLQVEARWISKLPMGEAIVRFPVRHYQSFLLAFPEQPLKNVRVSDEVVAARHAHVDETRSLSILSPASEKDDELLRDIAKNPISGIAERYSRLFWNPKTGNAVTRRLLARELVAFEHVVTPTGRIKILRLTVDGRAHLHELGFPLPPQPRGGVVHEYWRHILKHRLMQKGYRVQEEFDIGGGQAVDLHATKAGQSLFIEIETGKSDIASNITKCSSLSGAVAFFFTSAALSESCPELPVGFFRWTPLDLQGREPF